MSHYSHKKHNYNENMNNILSPIIPNKIFNNSESFINDSAFYNSIDFSNIFPLENNKRKNDIKICKNANFNIINKKEKINFGIEFQNLRKLNKEQLLELIIYIINISYLTLKDKKYINSIHKIFTLVKNMEKNCYDITIYKDIYNQNNLQNLIEKNNEIISKEKNNKNKYKDKKIENNENKDKNAHPIKLPIYCSIHDNKKFQTIKDYINHYKTTHNNNEYICFICKQKFISIRLLKRHFYKFISINDKDSYNNNYNNQSYNNKDYNNKVINNIKENIKFSNDYKKENNYIEKEDNFIANEIDKNEEKKLNYFYCEICNKYFNSKYSKEQHWENKGHDQLVYFCEICNKSFNSLKIKEQYCKHKNCNKVFLCKICNKMFKSKNAMETHCKMKNHYG